MVRLPVLLLACAVASGCVSTADPDEAASVTDQESLLNYLAGQGHLLVPNGLVRPALLTNASGLYRLEGSPERAEVAIYEFETEAEAERGLQTLQVEIRARTDRVLFARGRLVVVYEGGVPLDGGGGGGLRFSLSRVLERSNLA